MIGDNFFKITLMNVVIRGQHPHRDIRKTEEEGRNAEIYVIKSKKTKECSTILL